MCINCHRSSISLLVAALTIGKGAEYQPPATHSAKEQADIGENVKIALGDATRLLELTMFNHAGVGDDSLGGFEMTRDLAESLASFFAMLSDDRLWWLGKVLGQFRAQLDVTEDVAIDALKMRATEDTRAAVAAIVLGVFGAPPTGPARDARLN